MKKKYISKINVDQFFFLFGLVIIFQFSCTGLYFLFLGLFTIVFICVIKLPSFHFNFIFSAKLGGSIFILFYSLWRLIAIFSKVLQAVKTGIIKDSFAAQNKNHFTVVYYFKCTSWGFNFRTCLLSVSFHTRLTERHYQSFYFGCTMSIWIFLFRTRHLCPPLFNNLKESISTSRLAKFEGLRLFHSGST